MGTRLYFLGYHGCFPSLIEDNPYRNGGKHPCNQKSTLRRNKEHAPTTASSREGNHRKTAKPDFYRNLKSTERLQASASCMQPSLHVCFTDSWSFCVVFLGVTPHGTAKPSNCAEPQEITELSWRRTTCDSNWFLIPGRFLRRIHQTENSSQIALNRYDHNNIL